MAKIKNFGTGTPKFNEGIIVSGSNPQLYVSGNININSLVEPEIQFQIGNENRAKLSVNTSNNLVIHNQFTNKHIVFKVNDQGSTREGLRIDGAVPEVVVNEGSESLVNFRVESDNSTHMLFVTGSGKVGIGTASPGAPLHVYADASDYVAIIDNDQGSSGHGLKVTSDGTGAGTFLFDVESASTTLFRVRGDGRVGIGKVSSLPAAVLTVSSSNSDSDLAIAHKIHHIGDADTYMDFPSNDNITFAAAGSEELKIASDAVLVKQYIKHDGDEDTLINFTDDKIVLKAGNLALVTAEKKGSAPHEVTINDGGNNVDFVVKGNGSNAGNPGMKFDASNNRVGINGVGSPIAELDVAGKIAITEESSTPDQPSDGQGYLYTKSDGKIYWRSHDISEVDLTAAGGGGGSGDNLSLTALKTSNYTAANWEMVLVNLVGASGDVTVTLPAASANKQIAVKIAGASMGKEVIVDGNGSETIDGLTTRILNTDYESMHLISDGNNWWRIS